ncbi:MAG: SAM-dependent methyltransferase [Actinomycetales bacterium]|nr:MAG: SAM-dependent methyltransferase [Actinomycetales bacterium]
MRAQQPVTRVPTFHARRGRLSSLNRRRLALLGPRFALRDEVLAAACARRAAGRGRVVLEVGSGYGAAAIAYAATHPSDVLIAVDVHPSGVARTLAAADEHGLTNVCILLADAVELLELRVPGGALDAVHLFFPDPWPKTRHRRRRFVSPQTLDLLADRLTGTGEVLVATDSPEYAAYTERVVRDHGGFTAGRSPRPSWRPVEGYEAKGIAAGHPAIDLRLVRNG